MSIKPFGRNINKKMRIFFRDKNYFLKKLLVILIDFCLYFAIYFFSSSLVDQVDDPQKLEFSLLFSILNILCGAAWGNYKIVWRRFTFIESKKFIYASLFAVLLTYLLSYPPKILQFYVLLGILSLETKIIINLIYANWRVILPIRMHQENVIIIGAGSAGTQIYNQLKDNPSFGLRPIGFLDDALALSGRTVSGLPVLGKVNDIGVYANKISFNNVIIAIPSASKDQLNIIYEKVSKYNIKIQTLPSLHKILDGRVNVNQIREISPEDLLGRAPIHLNAEQFGFEVNSSTILITGAGGSIGSELCYQIAKLNPQKLILIEQSEYFLYEIQKNIAINFPKLNFVSILADVRNFERLNEIFSTYRPDIIFHAAAYKHVPILEDNAVEAVTTNLTGTYNVAKNAALINARRFVLVSTDKAVNPTNVMGASKRSAEIVCQYLAETHEDTSFMVVRFGNVLGSSGSVIPLFQKQIQAGGPVTVTHQDITRYFMSIPEAAQLVVHAGLIGTSKSIYVLDMGEPVKIIDLATQMIKLSGLEPYKDIDIKITGLRKGEKLYEELSLPYENTEKTANPKIKLLNSKNPISSFTVNALANLLEVDSSYSTDRVIRLLKDTVPEFKPKDNQEIGGSFK